MKQSTFIRTTGIVLFILFLAVSAITFVEFNNIKIHLKTIPQTSLIIMNYGVLAAGILGIMLFVLMWLGGESKSHERAHTTKSQSDETKFAAAQDIEIALTSEDILPQAERIASEIVSDTDKIADYETFAEKILSKICRRFEFVQGILFMRGGDDVFRMKSTFAYFSEDKIADFALGEGINGQVAKNGTPLIIENVPRNYITIVSGLGQSAPEYLMVYPIISDDRTIALVELASFTKFPPVVEKTLELLTPMFLNRLKQGTSPV